MTEAQDAGHKAHVVEPRKVSPRRRQLGSDTKDQKESSRRIQRKAWSRQRTAWKERA